MQLQDFQSIQGKVSFKIISGVNGESKGSSLKGGEGGILINGSGPSGKQGGSDGSAFGGTGYGAGGGGGGALYLHDGSVIYPGGTGAEGVVYIEMQHSGMFNSLCAQLAF